MKLAKPLAALTATMLVGTLAACSSDSTEADASPSVTAAPASSAPASPSASPSPTVSEEATASSAPVAMGELTPAGTELSTDEPLNVTLRTTLYNEDTEGVDYGDVEATYTFDAIREGSADDLSGVFGDEDIATLSGFDIAFVDYTVSLPAGALPDAAMGVSEVTELDVYDTSGARVSGGFVFFDGGPEICAYASQNDLVDSGSTTACQIVAITKGESIANFEFAGSDSGDADNPYEEAPIVWAVN
ncbi:hypothetical protein [Demequina aurantiaca]|uniref:hypothetical protein n=1 Tax=Demequina aurantiaca TaxID=676200 RepID=UPI003D34501C